MLSTALIRIGFLAFALCAFAVAPLPAQSAALHDGRHDFDFNIGTWHTQIIRVLNPLAGGTKTLKLDGSVTVRTVWGGRAQLEEIEADGTRGRWEGATLFLYDPTSHQWSQSFVDSANASFSTGLTGGFTNGRGMLYQSDTYQGRTILVRGTWSHITANAHQYEEDYSADGGATWHAAFISHLTRTAHAQNPLARTAGSAAFDFDLGTWKTESTRMVHPLTGSPTWLSLTGTTVVSSVWGGRANLAEYRASGPGGVLELLAFRIYNPQTHEWSIDFATPSIGKLGVPGVGTVRNGRMTFYDQENVNGRMVLVRFEIWSIGAGTAQSEQAFSDDGGTTWEGNWINRYTRISA